MLRELFQGYLCFGSWLPLGIVLFEVLGFFRGLVGSDIRGGLAWYEMMVEWGSTDGLARDTLVLGRGSC